MASDLMGDGEERARDGADAIGGIDLNQGAGPIFKHGILVKA